jgi:hypothetical protein
MDAETKAAAEAQAAAKRDKYLLDTVASLQRHDPVLKKLVSSEIGARGCKMICCALEGNTTVIEWHVSGSYSDEKNADIDLRDEGGHAVARMLQCNSSLTKVDFSRVKFGAVGASAIMDALQQNSSVKVFKIEYEELDFEGSQLFGRAVGQMLQSNSTLTELDLTGCQFIGSESALFISSGLEQNTNLRTLRICAPVWGALERNTALTALTCQRVSDTGLEGARAICRLLQQNSSILDLDLRGSLKTSEEQCIVLDALEQNSTLQSLSLYCNPDGVKRAVEVLQHNTTLTSLYHFCDARFFYYSENGEDEERKVPPEDRRFVEEILCQERNLIRRNCSIHRSKKLLIDNHRAQSVLISGATGPNASTVNGFFDPTSERNEERVRYRKRDNPSVRIDFITYPPTDDNPFDDPRYWEVIVSSEGTDRTLIRAGPDDLALEECRSCVWTFPAERAETSKLSVGLSLFGDDAVSGSDADPFGDVEPSNPFGDVEPSNPFGDVEPSNLFGDLDGDVEPSNPFGDLDGDVEPSNPFGDLEGDGDWTEMKGVTLHFQGDAEYKVPCPSML